MSAMSTETGHETEGGTAADRLLARLPEPLRTRGADPFAPPAGLTGLNTDGGLHRITAEDGGEVWLATGHEVARALLADPRMSSDRTRSDRLMAKVPPEVRARLLDEKARAGSFIGMDAPRHTRYRKLLTGQFTVRRMKALVPRVEEIVTGHLDAMVAAGPPADLVTSFALPVPSLVICELLGVAYADRELFQEHSARSLRLDAPLTEVMRALDDLRTFLYGLVAAKRAAPADDILSGLIAADATLSDDELVGIANLLLVAGHETTANMLALGTFALLEHPGQLAALRAEPMLVAAAVEELLRYLSIVHTGLVRTALADVPVGDRVIPAGALVEVSLPAANRDIRHYAEPDALDLRRPRGPHVAFGHGIHQCLGQQLARVEMTVGFTELLRRLPGLRLAVPAEEVPMRTDMAIYGVHSLPVTW
jgi:cytochrome P450